MSRIPRLLPLIAVAAGGVLSVKALSGIEGMPDALAGARAWAEDAQKPGKAPPKPEAAKVDPAKAAPAKETTTAAPAPAVCAPSATQLAREAGLSPAELQVLQSLGSRRTQLDQREADIDTQLQLLAAAEAKLDAKLKAMTGLRADIQGLLGQTQAKEEAEVARLVTVYSKMKPREAAAIMVQLDDRVRLPVAAKMKEAGLAAVLAAMPAIEAKKLTESLAKRFDQAQTKAEALAQAAGAVPTPAAPSATAAAKPPAQAVAKPATPAPKPAA